VNHVVFSQSKLTMPTIDFGWVHPCEHADLIMDKGFTSVGTLVERKTRYLMLIRLPKGRATAAL
jgi:hypothetical protein